MALPVTSFNMNKQFCKIVKGSGDSMLLIAGFVAD
jgi:hypothetical protein